MAHSPVFFLVIILRTIGIRIGTNNSHGCPSGLVLYKLARKAVVCMLCRHRYHPGKQNKNPSVALFFVFFYLLGSFFCLEPISHGHFRCHCPNGHELIQHIISAHTNKFIGTCSIYFIFFIVFLILLKGKFFVFLFFFLLFSLDMVTDVDNIRNVYQNSINCFRRNFQLIFFFQAIRLSQKQFSEQSKQFLNTL